MRVPRRFISETGRRGDVEVDGQRRKAVGEAVTVAVHAPALTHHAERPAVQTGNRHLDAERRPAGIDRKYVERTRAVANAELDSATGGHLARRVDRRPEPGDVPTDPGNYLFHARIPRGGPEAEAVRAARDREP